MLESELDEDCAAWRAASDEERDLSVLLFELFEQDNPAAFAIFHARGKSVLDGRFNMTSIARRLIQSLEKPTIPSLRLHRGDRQCLE